MKKFRILQIPPMRFGLVLGLINGFVGLIVAPILLVTLGAAATVKAAPRVASMIGATIIPMKPLIRPSTSPKRMGGIWSMRNFFMGGAALTRRL